MRTPSLVSAVAAAHPSDAEQHFGAKLAFETDCWDVHESFRTGSADFVLLDVRGPNAYARGHVPGALSLPHRLISSERMMEWPHETLFVVYCAGPHCNGADKAAYALARLGRPVKIMIGGITGWADEGFPFETSSTVEA
ncbi:MAG: rhodanese-like domain-containing protein [Hyphomicrobiales bacterium]|nr:MAG: rhodanese-like domain-containing protein [Hyphomicrobiales bacterium]